MAEFEQRLRVLPSDLDEQAHVNNVVYVRWVNDVAVAHWTALATPAQRAELGWVARRHEIDYLAAGVLDDAVLVRTWVGPADGLVYERHTEIRREHDGRVLARARTLWVPVSPRTGRPIRVSAELRALVSVPAPDAPDHPSAR